MCAFVVVTAAATATVASIRCQAADNYFAAGHSICQTICAVIAEITSD